MPSLAMRPRSNDMSSPFGAEAAPEPQQYDSSKAWIVAVAMIGTLVLSAVCIGLAVACYRRRRFQEEKTRGRDPYLTLKEFSRRSKLSVSDRTNEEEVQRREIIRKSLATRSSKSLSQVEIPGLPGFNPATIDDEEDESTGTLRDEWKEWEARMQMERVRTGAQHPLESSTDLTIPPKSQDHSPSRSPLLKHQQPAVSLPPCPQI